MGPLQARYDGIHRSHTTILGPNVRLGPKVQRAALAVMLVAAGIQGARARDLSAEASGWPRPELASARLRSPS